MRIRRHLALVALAAAAACSDSTAPLPPLNEAGVQADLSAAVSATSSPAVTSLAGLGPLIGDALAEAGGSLGAAEAPALMVQDPLVVSRSAKTQLRIAQNANAELVIPPAALGVTFVYDPELGRYAASDLIGAPLNGVRFLLYAVDPLTHEIVLPLVQTGHADITRTLANGVATARLEAYSGTQAVTKVLDYASRVSGNPATVLVEGFARNGADSLTFRLATAVSLVSSMVTLDWRSEVPTRALYTRVTQAISFTETAIQVALDAILRSGGGQVTMKGNVRTDEGGTITVKVNGDTFATITVSGALEESEPVITGPTGEPLTEAQVAMLRQIFDWFSAAFEFLESLLHPVEYLLDG